MSSENTERPPSYIGSDVIIIGGGDPSKFFGTQHRNSLGLLWGAEIKGGILSGNADSSKLFAERWGIPGFRNVEELLDSGLEFDYAVDATPNNCRIINSLPLLRAGRPVYSEKPLTNQFDTALELVEAAEQNNVPLGVSNTWAYGWAATVAKATAQSGKLGVAVGGSVEYFQDWAGVDGDRGHRGEPSQGGYWGSLADLGATHGGQAATDTANCTIAEVAAYGNYFKKGETERDATIMCRFSVAKGGWFPIHSSQDFGGFGNDMRVVVAYDSGALVEFNNTDMDTLWLTLPGYGSALKLQREADCSKIDFVQEAIEKTRVLFPHTSGHGQNQWKGHHGREFAPRRHTWGCQEAIATGHFRMGNWVRDWKRGGKKTVPENSHGTVVGRQGLHQMAILRAAEESEKDNHRPVAVR
jgi:predicted dehydrogenase